MTYAFAAPDIVSVPIQGSGDLFPVRNIYCVGRNYWAHREEMGVTDRDPPFFFAKCRDAILHCPKGGLATIAYPQMTRTLHHEIELVVAVGKGGQSISHAAAPDHIFGHAVGLDMTRRDLQTAAKKTGRPWDTGKNFAESGPIGDIVPIAQTGEITSGEISLSVNGETKQHAQMDEMIWSVREIIEALSTFYILYPGDLIFTGTPAGVGAVVAGDVMVGRCAGIGEITVGIG